MCPHERGKGPAAAGRGFPLHPFHDFLVDVLLDSGKIPPDFPIGDANDFEAQTFDFLCPLGIISFVLGAGMLFSVQFYDQTGPGAIEIHNETAQDFLPSDGYGEIL